MTEIYDCNQCDYQSERNSFLKRINIKFTKEYNIFVINAIFRSLKHLIKEHKQGIHGGQHYDCNYCEHKTTTKGDLEKHS